MGKYSIKEIEQLTGIKAHTFRIWEQRYNILIPHRTATNIRYYDDEQLKLALNLSYLNRNGLKISKLAKLTKNEIGEQVTSHAEKDNPEDFHLNALIVSTIEMDENKFHKSLCETIDNKGVELSFQEIIFPFLRKIGFMWSNGNITPAQEHFASNILRREIITRTAQLKKKDKKIEKFVLFLPEGELHELGLLLSDYMIQSRGFKTFYLGASVPVDDIKSVVRIAKPHYLFCVITNLSNGLNIKEYIDEIAALSDTKLILTGNQLLFKDIELPKNVILLKELKETSQFLNKISH